jgi:hypothetical protein
VTLKFSEARPYFFPSAARRLKGENERRVTNVKGAERISFSVCHAAFLLSTPTKLFDPIQMRGLRFFNRPLLETKTRS